MDLEYSITQYLDGALSDSQRDALEVRLATDAAARAMLEEHEKLDGLLKSGGVPQLQWEAIAAQISLAVASAEMPAAQSPARSLKMPWVRMAAPLALAASVLISAGLAIRLIHFGASPAPTGNGSAGGPAIAVITGPQPETSSAPALLEISVGPAHSVAGDSILPHYSDDVISRPARVTVASGINPPSEVPPSSPLDAQ
jgi:anti-sigma factor RsiW